MQNTKQEDKGGRRLGETCDAYPNVIQSTAEIDSQRLLNDSQLPVARPW